MENMKMEAKTYLKMMKVIMATETMMMRAMIHTINSSKIYFTMKMKIINKTINNRRITQSRRSTRKSILFTGGYKHFLQNTIQK
jgi:hypothetical protein